MGLKCCRACREIVTGAEPAPEMVQLVDSITQCSSLSFPEGYDITITGSGSRYHTHRCHYVNNANQRGLKFYAKCPTCASEDLAAEEAATRSSEDESVSWAHDPSQGFLAHEQQNEMGVGN